MRIVTMEEHFSIPELQKRISGEVIEARGFFSKDKPYGPAGPGEKMENLEKGRIEAMDAAGVTVQVLSHEGPGSDLLPASESPAWAKEANDILAGHVKKHPARYAGFAHLPLTAPKAAAVELERCVQKLGFVGTLVNGSTSGKFLDAPEYDDVLAVAEKLDVPIYLHPNIPVKAVRESYYEGGLPKELSYLFGIAGFGWHVDTAVHVLRLVLSGALDRHPKLKLITGHMGEMLPGMLARFDQMFETVYAKTLKRRISEQITEQVWVSTSGFITVPPLLTLLETFGADHVLLSADYPFMPMEPTTKFLEAMPVSPADREKIAHGNADKLMKLKA